MKPFRAFFTWTLVATGGLFLLCTFSLSPQARLVPLVVVVPMLGLLVFQVLLDTLPSLAGLRAGLEKKDVFRVEPLRQASHPLPGAKREETEIASMQSRAASNEDGWEFGRLGVWASRRPEAPRPHAHTPTRPHVFGGAGSGQPQREWSVLAWLLMLLVLSDLLGFLLSGPLFTVLYLRGRSGEGWRRSLAVALGMYGVLHGIFVLLLRIRLHEGRLWEWLRG